MGLPRARDDRAGTWVQVGKLRLGLLEAAPGLLQDAVICGHDRDYIAVLAWPDPGRCRELVGTETDTATVIGSPEVAEAGSAGSRGDRRLRPATSLTCAEMYQWAWVHRPKKESQ